MAPRAGQIPRSALSPSLLPARRPILRTMPAPRLIVDHVVATDAALVDLRIEMLEHGAISVRGVTAVELVQETFGPTHTRLAWADELELQRSFRPPWSRE